VGDWSDISRAKLHSASLRCARPADAPIATLRSRFVRNLARGNLYSRESSKNRFLCSKLESVKYSRRDIYFIPAVGRCFIPPPLRKNVTCRMEGEYVCQILRLGCLASLFVAWPAYPATGGFPVPVWNHAIPAPPHIASRTVRSRGLVDAADLGGAPDIKSCRLVGVECKTVMGGHSQTQMVGHNDRHLPKVAEYTQRRHRLF
jgi:hypothetical protein